MPHFPGRQEKSVAIMYGKEDLSSFPVFQGGFINFGYWDPVPKNPTKEDRIKASRRLYEEVLNHLVITNDDKVLEIGCGQGLGCQMVLDLYQAKQVWGLDATPEQIDRCQEIHKTVLQKGNLHFVHGFDSKMPFSDGEFTKVYSVEAAQHFPSLPEFFHEVSRTLQPAGKFVLTTFFRKKGASLEEIGQYLPTANNRIDYFHPFGECLTQLKGAGFDNIDHANIGKYVWEGFDKWNAIVAPNEWGRNWFKVHKRGLVDYYIIEGSKPK